MIHVRDPMGFQCFIVHELLGNHRTPDYNVFCSMIDICVSLTFNQSLIQIYYKG